MLLLAATSLTVSCSREKSGFGIEDPTPNRPGIQDEAMAYLDLSSGLSVTVHKDGEVVNTHEGDSARTRSAVDNEDLFTVEIYSQKGDSVAYKSTYGAIKALEQPIALPVGTYKIRIYSAEMKDVAWETDEGQPTYGAETDYFDLTIDNDEENPYTFEDNIVCQLQSIEVSVLLEEELEALCQNTTVEVKLEDETVTNRTITFNDETGNELYTFGIIDLEVQDDNSFTQIGDAPIRVSKNAFLAPIHEENHLIARFKTTIDGTEIDKRVSVTAEAKAGQWHKVSLYLKSGPEDNTGNIAIGATVETWVYNELVEVKSLGSELTEEVIPDINDPNAPRIIPRDGCFFVNDTNHITASNYTTDGDYNKNAIIDVTTQSNITRFAVRLRTDNASLRSYLQSSSLYNKSIDLLSTAPEEMTARNVLHSMGFPRAASIKDGKQHAINLKDFMTFLAPYSGNHELTIAVTDEQGLYSRIDIDIDLNLAGGSAQPVGQPTITWRNKNIDQRYEAELGLECVIVVDCPKGIKEFMVDISGQIVSMLDEVHIPNHFSLVDPDPFTLHGQDKKLSETLAGMGFPVTTDVKNQTRIDGTKEEHEASGKAAFDISEFMGALKATCPEGQSDFRLTVTDNDGNVVSKAIMLNVTK